MLEGSPQGAGAPAPQSGAGSSNSSAGQASTGSGFDAQEAFNEIRQTRAQTSKLASAFDSHRKETGEDRDLLKRIKEAVAPPKEEAADPISDLEGQMDYYLEQAMEAKQRGQAIPLTTNLAIRFFQSQIENIKTQELLRNEIKALRGGVDHANDPQTPVNNMAYSQMETFLQQSLDNLYGADEKQLGTKRRIYQAVTSSLVQDLKQLQQQAPAQWDMLRRNPMKLQKVVNQALRDIVPPRAMHLIEQETLQNTPLSEGELWAAFREAKELMAKDPKKSIELQRDIRRDILEMQQRGTRKKRG